MSDSLKVLLEALGGAVLVLLLARGFSGKRCWGSSKDSAEATRTSGRGCSSLGPPLTLIHPTA